jgi:hypothetical protein
MANLTSRHWFYGWSIGNHLDNSVKGVSWVCDLIWTRHLG